MVKTVGQRSRDCSECECGCAGGAGREVGGRLVIEDFEGEEKDL